MKRRELMLGAAALTVAGCSDGKISRKYYGPLADGIIVRKAERRMFLLNGKQVIASYDVDLGFTPTGHKVKSGDGRTPEGQYFIDRRNYNSAYHLSLGISYPNARDRARARAAGVSPGGDIFIHGGPRLLADRGKPDWTAGCISVTDAQMEMVFQMVPVGTPIWITA